MDPITFNPQDTEYFVGEVFDVLLDPTAKFYRQPPVDHVFNPAWPVQSFEYPEGTGTVRRLQFVVDENGEPFLATYIIPSLQTRRLNMIGNPNMEQALSGTMPLPLIPLKPNWKIVKTADPVTSGLFAGLERWMVVDTSKTPKTPINSPAGGSYTDADRARDNAMSIQVGKIARALGI